MPVSELTEKPPALGLVLQGGGARGAYQVGVLKALAEIHGDDGGNPFPIISGTSVGAINAACLVSHAMDFFHAANKLEKLWRGLKTKHIFDPSWKSLRGTAWRIIRTFGFGAKANRYGWLDNRPLRKLLEREFDRAGLEQAIDAGALDAFSISTSCYGCGISTTWFESRTNVQPWQRHRRDGKRETIAVDHLLASSALPLIFPAVRIGDTYHGDGAMRLTAPLSPAIRMGATRLLVVGVRDAEVSQAPHTEQKHYPSIGEMGGTALDILFNDSLDADIERANRINRLLDELTPQQRAKDVLDRIEVLSLQPSQDLRSIASQFEHEMPRPIKAVLRALGATGTDGRMPSYLLFEPGYINALIELGYEDTIARRDEVEAFISASNYR